MNIGRSLSHVVRERLFQIFSYNSVSIPRAPRLKPDDVMLLSYPRSGNTWLRTICAFMMYEDRQIKNFDDITRLLPDVYWGISNFAHYSKPRIIKTHQPYAFAHEINNKMLYQRCIYIVRHPYQVVISFFKLQKQLFANPETSLDRFVEQFVSGRVPGNCSWQEHVISWTSAARDREMLILKYEDLSTDPASIIRQVGMFLGQIVSDEKIQIILQKTSRKAMNNFYNKNPLIKDGQSLVSDPAKDVEKVKLSEKHKQIIWTHCQEAMKLFDYSNDGLKSETLVRAES